MKINVGWMMSVIDLDEMKRIEEDKFIINEFFLP